MHAETCGKNKLQGNLKMIKMSASKAMFLASVVFSLIFLGFSILQVITCLLKGLFT